MSKLLKEVIDKTNQIKKFLHKLYSMVQHIVLMLNQIYLVLEK